MNSNKYTRNIGSNEFVSDGIELTTNSNKITRNIGDAVRMNSVAIESSSKLGKKHIIGEIDSYSKFRNY